MPPASLENLCMLKICSLFYETGRTSSYYYANLGLPQRFVNDLLKFAESIVYVQISQWHRRHMTFYDELSTFFSCGRGVKCEHRSEVLSLVLNFRKFAWTPDLRLDSEQTAKNATECIPKDCALCGQWTVLPCDPTTCRDGLEFDTEEMLWLYSWLIVMFMWIKFEENSFKNYNRFHCWSF